jgi:hypothetical protein
MRRVLTVILLAGCIFGIGSISTRSQVNALDLECKGVKEFMKGGLHRTYDWQRTYSISGKIILVDRKYKASKVNVSDKEISFVHYDEDTSINRLSGRWYIFIEDPYPTASAIAVIQVKGECSLAEPKF